MQPLLLLTAEQIVVGDNRQRREFSPASMTELKDSILEVGLLQPIVVREADTSGFYQLVAGERRLRALIELERQHIPCVSLGALSELDRELAELDENIKRVDLTWQEKNSALVRLHRLRGEEQRAKGESQSLSNTAREALGSTGHSGTVKAALMIDEFKHDSDVMNAKSTDEAMSIVRKKLLNEFNAELAKRVSTTESPHTLLGGDCRTVLPTMPASTFDVIITDPPYGVNMHKMSPLSGSNSGVSHNYDDTFEYARTVWEAILVEGFRVCKPDAALYMFYDARHEAYLFERARDAGWTVWPTAIIWHKPSGGMLGDSTHGPRKCYERIMFAYKGDKRTTGLYSDVISMESIHSIDHAAAKPVPLYTDLMRRSCLPNSRVLDPCVGGGTFFQAATTLSLRATGIEISSTHEAAAKLKIVTPL